MSKCKRKEMMVLEWIFIWGKRWRGVVIVVIVGLLNLGHKLILGASGDCWKFSLNWILAVISKMVLILINLLLESIRGTLILLKGHFFRVVVEATSIAFQISSLTKDCRHISTSDFIFTLTVHVSTSYRSLHVTISSEQGLWYVYVMLKILCVAIESVILWMLKKCKCTVF